MKYAEYLTFLIMLGLLLGNVVAWRKLFGRLLMGRTALPFRRPQLLPWTILDLLLIVSVMIVCQYLLMQLANWIGFAPDANQQQTASGETRLIFLGSLAAALGLLISMALVSARTGATWRDFGLRLRTATWDLRIGLYVFLLLSVPIYLIQWVLSWVWTDKSHPLIEILRDAPAPQYFLLSLVTAVLLAPIIEEMLFRVFLQGWLEKIAAYYGRRPHVPSVDVEDDSNMWQASESMSATPRGDRPDDFVERGVWPYRLMPIQWESKHLSDHKDEFSRRPVRLDRRSPWPIVISSAIFSMAHWGHGPAPIPLFVFSLGLGYLYQSTHRILPCIVVHMLLNGFSMLILWLSLQGGHAL